MLLAVAACFVRGSPAVFTRAVTLSAVRLAGLEPADHNVSAARHPTDFFAAVFAAEPLAVSFSSAARHRARLLRDSAVSDAPLEPGTRNPGDASINLAHWECTMSSAETPFYSKSDAAFNPAHFRAATTMPDAPSFFNRFSGSGAIADSAEPKGAVFQAEATNVSSCAAPFGRAGLFSSMSLAKPPYFSEAAAAFHEAVLFVFGMDETHFLSLPRIPHARPRCTDPVGAVQGACKPTCNSGSLAVFLCAEAVYPTVLPAMATPLLRVACAFYFFAFTHCTVLCAQAERLCPGGAASKRARLSAMRSAEVLCFDFVRAAIHRAYLHHLFLK